MRQHTIYEIEQKTTDYFLDVEFAGHHDVKYKLTQLMNFLYSQDISRNVLDRITREYTELRERLALMEDSSPERAKQDVLKTLLTPDLQGAFGYFLINKKFKDTDKGTSDYIDLSWKWYSKGYNMVEQQQGFNSYFLKPFQELFNWYLAESEIDSENDYFSYKAQDSIFEMLRVIEEKIMNQGFGQEIIFNEIDELKELTKKVNKKNWGEIVLAKFLKLALAKVLTYDVARQAIEFLTGRDLDSITKMIS